MITRMSKSISSFFIVHGVIPEDDRDVYVYSFEVLFSNIVSFFTLAVLAIISKTVLETVFYLIGFVPLRKLAGGYHAKNNFRCFLVLMLTYLVFLLILYMFPIGYRIPVSIMSTILTVLSVFILAPSEDSNKPLSSEEISQLRRESRYAVVGYVALICLLSVFTFSESLVFSAALGGLTVSIALMANLIKCKNGITGNNSMSRRGGEK